MADSVPARDTGAAEEAADKAGGTAIETLPSSIAHREEEKEGERHESNGGTACRVPAVCVVYVREDGSA